VGVVKFDETWQARFPWVNTWWGRTWNHWLNPLGNAVEPDLFPEKMLDKCYSSSVYKFFARLGQPGLGRFVWWQVLRNFAHNLGAYWLGIVPIPRRRFEQISPTERGWKRRYLTGWMWGKVQFWVMVYEKPNRLPAPCLYWRFPYASKDDPDDWMEGYIGILSRGNLGLAFRDDDDDGYHRGE